MNILPQLNLNKHPRTCIPNSLVDCRNMMFDIEKGVMSNENVLESKDIIKEDVLVNYINSGNLDGEFEDYEIIGSINCAKEIVYFIKYKLQDIDNFYVCLYRTSNDKVYLHKQQIEYIENAKIVGNHVYNYNNELIIVFSQYVETNDKYFPLCTINLDDSDEEEYKLPLVPEVKIPSILNYDYVSGNWYKGQNYFFIRYKIDKYNYTQWYDLHKMIYTDDFQERDIIRVNLFGDYKATVHEDNFGVVSDVEKDVKQATINKSLISSSQLDISDKCININLVDIDYRYDKFQIGVIVISKKYTKAFVSNDTNFNNITISINNLNTEIAVNEFITDYYNYYNVKTIHNFKNKLHISNYIEKYLRNNDTPTGKIIYGGNINNEEYEYPTAINDKFAYCKFRYNNKNYWFPISDNEAYDTILPYSTFVFHDGSGTKANRNYNSDTYPMCRAIPVGFIIWAITNGQCGYHIGDDDDGIDIDGIIDYNSKNHKVQKLSSHGVENSLNVDREWLLDCDFNYREEPYTGNGFFTLNSDGDRLSTAILVFASINAFNKLDVISNGVKYVIDSNDIEFIDDYFISDSDETQVSVEFDKFKFRSLIPNEYYSFFIHYVDKYGLSTDGFPINIEGSDYNEITKSYIIKIPFESITSAYYLRVENITIPDGYIGWFVSYEAFERSNKYVLYNKKNSSLQNCFYGTKLDYDEAITINFDKLINLSTLESSDISKVILNPVNNYDNLLLSTKFKLNGNYENENWYLFYDSKSKYNNVNKTLIPLTPVYYTNDDRTILEEGNYNGVLTQVDAIIFNKKYQFDAGKGKLIEINSFDSYVYTEDYQESKLNITDVNNNIIIKTRYIIADFFNESKKYLNPPKTIVTTLNADSENPNYFIGVYIDVQDTIDLFEMPQYYINEAYPKVLLNFNEDNKYISIVDKTIIRSNAMNDESLENSWRKFDVEQYINIRENKGKIFNLFSIGNAFYVHTEHSLFQFDYNDRLTSNGDVVEVSQKDIFDTRYNELFNSDLGFGGLQDRNAYCVGDFGYMWYNTDFKRFFILSKEGPKDISATINGWLSKVDITNVQFGDDKDRKRLLIMFNDTNNVHCLSYNYAVPGFVSIHDLTDIYNKGDNRFFAYTKKDLFIIDNSGKHIFKFNNNKYVSVFNLAIINNVNFDDIKFIEYIQYIMAEIQSNSDNVVDIDYWSTPVKGNDGNLIPYSGDELVISSEETITDIIDLKTTDETNKQHTTINKPYYELGKWNFNKVVDKRKNRMFGKYIVSNFKFNRDNNNKVEFESINVALTKYRK